MSTLRLVLLNETSEDKLILNGREFCVFMASRAKTSDNAVSSVTSQQAVVADHCLGVFLLWLLSEAALPHQETLFEHKTPDKHKTNIFIHILQKNVPSKYLSSTCAGCRSCIYAFLLKHNW